MAPRRRVRSVATIVALAIVAILLVVLGRPPGEPVAVPSPSPPRVPSSPSPPAGSASPSVALLSPPSLAVPGRVSVVRLAPTVMSVAADGTSVAAVRVLEPGPIRAEIHLADVAQDPPAVRRLVETEAFVNVIDLSGGRVAFDEYRETGGGGFTFALHVLAVGTGQRQQIWSGSFSPATFRGGGGGPKRVHPSARLALDGDRLAYVHVTERAGGELEGELRVRDLRTGAERAIARSAVWIEPVGLDGSELAYAVGGSPNDEIRIVDLGSGRETVAVRARLIRSAAFRGPFVAYTTTDNEQAGPFRVMLRDVRDGSERQLDANGTRVSLSGRHAAWYTAGAGPRGLRIFDLARARETQPLSGAQPYFDIEAVDAGLLLRGGDGATIVVARID
ncbi:MAG TPA: hypothetical protein VFM93_00860 [Candidatus Limnocylindria bacterium]|nr:hypothetical protein [Candidatus Limnocylindria bacterium]